MTDKQYELMAITEIAARVITEIMTSNQSSGWKCNDSVFREAVQEKLQVYNLELEKCSDNTDTWRLGDI